MSQPTQSEDTLIDFITGCQKPNCGAEGNRQEVEQFLVETKNYDRKDIEVDAAIELDIDNSRYQSTIDLVVSVNGLRFMVIKCAAGSLDSREREVISAARLMEEAYQIPLSVASDGCDAYVWDTVSGGNLGRGIDAIPSKKDVLKNFDPTSVAQLDEKRRARQKLIFRAYATRSCKGSA